MSAPIDRVTLDDIELEYFRIEGRGTPTLVFLHEGLGSALLWRKFPEAVARSTGLPALIYSRYGNGFSAPLREPREPRYMHDEALTALPALLDALGIDDVVLIGHSDGASIAIVFAAEYPERTKALVLEAPHLFVEDLSVASIASIRTVFETSDLRARMQRHHADADRTFYGWNDVWLSGAFRSWDVNGYAARLQAPVLAVQGDADEYGTPAQIDALAALARGSVDRVLLAGCGHAPHRDRAVLMEMLAAQWVRETIGRR